VTLLESPDALPPLSPASGVLRCPSFVQGRPDTGDPSHGLQAGHPAGPTQTHARLPTARSVASSSKPDIQPAVETPRLS
jgi:hypothetical protein